MGTKTVRFSEEEESLIGKFLEHNQFFDFSTLARVAILSFIKKPEMPLVAITHPVQPLQNQVPCREN